MSNRSFFRPPSNFISCFHRFSFDVRFFIFGAHPTKRRPIVAVSRRIFCESSAKLKYAHFRADKNPSIHNSRRFGAAYVGSIYILFCFCPSRAHSCNHTSMLETFLLLVFKKRCPRIETNISHLHPIIQSSPFTHQLLQLIHMNIFLPFVC